MFRRKKRSKLKRIVRLIISVIILGVFFSGLGLGIKFFINAKDSNEISVGSLKLPGEVAGVFVQRINQTSVQGRSQDSKIANNPNTDNSSGSDESNNKDDSVQALEPNKEEDENEILLKIGIASDSSDDLESLRLSVDKFNDSNLNYVAYLGDYSRVGDLPTLKQSYEVISSLNGIPWFTLSGDHDIAQTLDETNFNDVFGESYGIYETDGIKIMMFSNPYNKTKLSDTAMDWFKNNISDADFVLLSQPLYTKNMNSTFGVMGYYDGEEIPDVKAQADEILQLIRDEEVMAVISGDHHFYSRSPDPLNPNLTHYTVPALRVTDEFDFTPQVLILNIYTNKKYSIEKEALL